MRTEAARGDAGRRSPMEPDVANHSSAAAPAQQTPMTPVRRSALLTAKYSSIPAPRVRSAAMKRRLGGNVRVVAGPRCGASAANTCFSLMSAALDPVSGGWCSKPSERLRSGQAVEGAGPRWQTTPAERPGTSGRSAGVVKYRGTARAERQEQRVSVPDERIHVAVREGRAQDVRDFGSPLAESAQQSLAGSEPAAVRQEEELGQRPDGAGEHHTLGGGEPLRDERLDHAQHVGVGGAHGVRGRDPPTGRVRRGVARAASPACRLGLSGPCRPAAAGPRVRPVRVVQRGVLAAKVAVSTISLSSSTSAWPAVAS